MPDNIFALLLLSSYAVVVAFYFSVVAGRSLFPTGTTLFFLWQSVAVLGTFFLTEGSNTQVGIARLQQITTGMVAFVFGAWLANRLNHFQPFIDIRRFKARDAGFDIKGGVYRWGVLGIAAVSVVVALIFLNNLGTGVLWDSLSEYLATGNLEDSHLAYSRGRRLVHGSSGVYLASGYSFQFIATLLPTTVCLLYARMKVTNRTNDKVLFVVLFLVAVLALTIPGNRGIMLNYFLVLFFLGSPRWGPLGKRSGSSGWRIALVTTAVAFFALTTALAGRVGTDMSLGRGTSTAISDLYTRIVVLPSENQMFFMQNYDGSELAGGRGWLQSLKNVLPGTERVSLSAKLSWLYSGDWGSSSPPDFWTSIVWNFGWAGILIVPLLTGYLIQRLAVWFFTETKSLSKIIIIFVSFFSLREITDPVDYFNQGFVTLMIYLGVMVIIKTSERVAGRGRQGLPRAVRS